MGMETNQPVVEGVTQDEKNNASIIQGLVLGAGVLGFIPFINFFGWLCSIAVIVLYFVWKDKGPFVGHHARQGMGLQLILVAVGIVLAIIGAIVAAATFSSLARGSLGGIGAIGTVGMLFTVIGFAINIGSAVLGLLGLLAAQKGETYTYPVIGNFITNFGKKA